MRRPTRAPFRFRDANDCDVAVSNGSCATSSCSWWPRVRASRPRSTSCGISCTASRSGRARSSRMHTQLPSCASHAARLALIATHDQTKRDERLRFEEARVAAEREARLRVEAHEASERARLAAHLEQERMAQEMELRRADIAQRRPRWMIAVTVLALAGGVGFAALAVDRMPEADAAEQAKAPADKEMVAAKQEMQEAVAT